MLNVAMMNFCYDVPVKQFSSHLCLMALFIMLPEAQRLANVLFWRPTHRSRELKADESGRSWGMGYANRQSLRGGLLFWSAHHAERDTAEGSRPFRLRCSRWL